VSYSSVKSILKSSLDRAPIDDEASATRLPKEHENIRGPEYYGSGDAQLTLLADDTTMGGDPDRSDDRSAVTEQMGPTTFPEMLPILTNHAQTPTTGGI
jgi:hypothetical protein